MIQIHPFEVLIISVITMLNNLGNLFSPASSKSQIVIAQLFLIVAVSGTTPFGCKNTLISDEWREIVLKFHNNIRRKIAQGNQPTKTAGKVMPVAQDMIELTWDCDIENNAFLSTCDQNTVQIPADYASNSAALPMTGKKCNIRDNTMTVLKSWYDQVKLEDFQNDATYNEQTQKEFGIMVNGATSGFACSYSKCGNDGKLLCLYNQPFVALCFALKELSEPIHSKKRETTNLKGAPKQRQII
ncbi:hypothetical protein Y032_0048g1591 [Ancylostoma ceylanicum]|nr:hypothetical protein Y032_0048g1591 [Ancylostoma ceylanicum]